MKIVDDHSGESSDSEHFFNSEHLFNSEHFFNLKIHCIYNEIRIIWTKFFECSTKTESWLHV